MPTLSSRTALIWPLAVRPSTVPPLVPLSVVRAELSTRFRSRAPLPSSRISVEPVKAPHLGLMNTGGTGPPLAFFGR